MGPMRSLREDGGIDDVTRLADGNFQCNLSITSSFLRGDGLSFVVTGLGTQENESKNNACFQALKQNTMCDCDILIGFSCKVLTVEICVLLSSEVSSYKGL